MYFRRPLSGRSAGRPHSARSESERPPSARPFERPRSGERPRSSERPHSGRGERPLSARRRRDSLESSASSVRRKKIQAFKENRSAKTIQRNWRTHQQDKVGKMLIIVLNWEWGLGWGLEKEEEE